MKTLFLLGYIALALVVSGVFILVLFLSKEEVKNLTEAEQERVTKFSENILGIPEKVQDKLARRLLQLQQMYPSAKKIRVELDHDAWTSGRVSIKYEVFY